MHHQGHAQLKIDSAFTLTEAGLEVARQSWTLRLLQHIGQVIVNLDGAWCNNMDRSACMWRKIQQLGLLRITARRSCTQNIAENNAIFRTIECMLVDRINWYGQVEADAAPARLLVNACLSVREEIKRQQHSAANRRHIVAPFATASCCQYASPIHAVERHCPQSRCRR